MRKIAMLTIGQTPRPDIAGDLRSLLPPGVELTEFGVCDGMEERAVTARFGYRGTGRLLVTRLREGALIELSEDAVLRGMQDCIRRAEDAGAELLLAACTGVFPAYRHRRPLVFPGSLQRRNTIARAGGAPVGVLIPVEEQRDEIRAWWRADGAPDVLLEAANPFGDVRESEAAAMRLRARGARVLCMDCFGYALRARDCAARKCGLEIVLPREELAREAVRLLAGDS